MRLTYPEFRAAQKRIQFLVKRDYNERVLAFNSCGLLPQLEQKDFADDLKLGEDMMHLLLHLYVLQLNWEQENEFVKE